MAGFVPHESAHSYAGGRVRGIGTCPECRLPLCSVARQGSGSARHLLWRRRHVVLPCLCALGGADRVHKGKLATALETEACDDFLIDDDTRAALPFFCRRWLA